MTAARHHDATSTAPQHLVLGTGPLGIATAEALHAMGHTVAMVNRSGTAPDGVTIPVLAGSVLNDTDRTRLFATATTVYQCAQPAYTRWPEEFPALQEAVLRGARERKGALRVIIADNLYGYGLPTGPLDETTPMHPNSRKGAVRAQMATDALAAHARGEVPVAIVRGSDFFGPHVVGSALGDRVWEPLVRGKTAQAAGNVDLLHSYTYIGDFGRALAILGTNPRGDGEVWHAPTAAALSTRALLELSAPLVPGPVRVSGTGRMMMRIAGLFIPEARESVEMMYEFEHPFVMSSEKFTRAFGVQATPLANAVSATVAWFRQREGEG